MRRHTASLVVVLGTLLPWWLATPRFAKAQPILDRLEQQIRSRLEQADPNDAAGEERAKDPADEPAAAPPDQDAAAAKRAPGYVGVLADDEKDRGQGVRILDVRPGGPAQKAGLKKQDLITGVAGIQVRQMSDMAEVLDLFPAGDSVTFDVLRGQQRLAVKIVLGRRPAVAGQASPQPADRKIPSTKPPAAEAPRKPPDLPSAPVETLVPPPATRDRPPDASAEIQRMRSRLEQLERRVAELERALVEALQKQ